MVASRLKRETGKVLNPVVRESSSPLWGLPLESEPGSSFIPPRVPPPTGIPRKGPGPTGPSVLSPAWYALLNKRLFNVV